MSWSPLKACCSLNSDVSSIIWTKTSNWMIVNPYKLGMFRIFRKCPGIRSKSCMVRQMTKHKKPEKKSSLERWESTQTLFSGNLKCHKKNWWLRWMKKGEISAWKNLKLAGTSNSKSWASSNSSKKKKLSLQTSRTSSHSKLKRLCSSMEAVKSLVY